MKIEEKIEKIFNERKKMNEANIRLGDTRSLGGKLGNAAERIQVLKAANWYYDQREEVLSAIFNREVQLEANDIMKITKLPYFSGISSFNGKMNIDFDLSGGVPKDLLHKSFYDEKGNFDPE